MSLPRPIHPGSRYLLTRRTAHRQFLLRPNDATSQIILYALAYAAHISGVVVHAFVAMSNHIHVVVTDPDGRLPEFLHLLHRHIACCMNVSLGRTENFWASTPPNVVALETEDDVLDKIAYVIANPTSAGLVSEPAHWPGVITPAAGMRITAQRPDVFFQPNGKMPASIDLEVSVPQPIGPGGIEGVVSRLRDLVEQKLCAARAAIAEANRVFLGPDGVLAVSLSDAPSTTEPAGARRPQFAARDKKQRRQVLELLRAFYLHYAAAMAAWLRGDRRAIFPAGTYLMRVLHGVFVEPAPG